MPRAPLVRPRQPKRPQGVVLIVVLVMLVIIGLTSAAVMRNALSADLVSANVRSEALATEAAQSALAYCEGQVIATPTMVQDAVGPTEAERWEDLSRWLSTGTGAPLSPPTWATETTDKGSASGRSVTKGKAPQCMAERSRLSSAGNIVIVTARGFTPDFAEDATTGRITSGSAVWLQSQLRLQ